MGKQAEAEAEADDPGSVATKDVNAMYLVMRQRVAKMEARVDERLNQVNGLNSTFEVHTLSFLFCQVESMLCATLLPLAKSLDQLVQQNVDQVTRERLDDFCCVVGIGSYDDDGEQSVCC